MKNDQSVGVKNTVAKRGTRKGRSSEELMARLDERIASLEHKANFIKGGLIDTINQMARLLDQHLPDWREHVTFPPISE